MEFDIVDTMNLRNLAEREADFSKNDLEEVQKLLVSAARDCVPQDRNSFVVIQSKTGVEVTSLFSVSSTLKPKHV